MIQIKEVQGGIELSLPNPEDYLYLFDEEHEDFDENISYWEAWDIMMDSYNRNDYAIVDGHTAPLGIALCPSTEIILVGLEFDNSNDEDAKEYINYKFWKFDKAYLFPNYQIKDARELLMKGEKVLFVDMGIEPINKEDNGK